jgi:hypothetical protein
MRLFDEIIINILSYCEFNNINLKLVSKKFNNLINEIFYDSYVKLFYNTDNFYTMRSLINLLKYDELHQGFLITCKNMDVNYEDQIIELFLSHQLFDPHYENDLFIKYLIHINFKAIIHKKIFEFEYCDETVFELFKIVINLSSYICNSLMFYNKFHSRLTIKHIEYYNKNRNQDCISPIRLIDYLKQYDDCKDLLKLI